MRLKEIVSRLTSLPYFFRKWHYTYTRFRSHFERTFVIIGNILGYIAATGALCCLVLLLVQVGFDLVEEDSTRVYHLLRVIQVIFIINVLYQIFFSFREKARNSRIIKWIADIVILVTILPLIYPMPSEPWIPWLKTFLYSRKFLYIILGFYSVVDISYTVSKIPGRRTNPSVMMALSFLIFIIVGSLVLMLPKCTYSGIGYFDSLFVSSSAVCITGLTPVDVPSTFTPLGLLVIAVLVQLGSLGVITFTSFFAMFFAGNTSIYNQLILKDIIYSKSMNALIPTLLYVLGFTITIEIIGAVCVYFSIPDTVGLDMEQRMIFSAFHSMSSFCNAGFSCLPDGMSNPAMLHSNQVIYIVTSVLIFAGAIGFPILVNFKEILYYNIKKLWNKIRHVKSRLIPLHMFDLNTKIVLYTTMSVLIVGSISFFILEYDNSLAGMSLYEKVVQSVFNSLIPRSAGFASVNPSTFLDITLLILVAQMIIGGSSQSMAGGIKVNTLGVIILNLKAVVKGHAGVTAFNRRIDGASVRRANAVVAISIFALLFYCVTLLCLEPTLPTKSVLFEVVSALFTVGSSLGITSELCDTSKIVLSTAMFLGRVGILSLLMGLVHSHYDRSPLLPADNVIIN